MAAATAPGPRRGAGCGSLPLAVEMRAAGLVVSLEDAAPPGAIGRAVASGLREAGLCRVDAAWIAVTHAARERAAPAARDAIAALEAPSAPVVALGCDGVAGAALECLDRPALAVWALEGVEARTVRAHPGAGREREIGPELRAGLEGFDAPGDWWALAADGTALAAPELARGLRGVAGAATLTGLGALPLELGPRGPGLEPGGVGALAIRASRPVDVAVARAGRALTGELRLDGVRGHWIRRLGGRPALEVLREAVGPALAGDLDRATRLVKLERVSDGRLVNLVGRDPRTGALAVAEPLERGTSLRLSILEPAHARESLAEALGRANGHGVAGLYLASRARGSRLFQHDGLEAGYLARALPGVAWIACYGGFQLAPAGEAPSEGSVALAYAGVLACLAA